MDPFSGAETVGVVSHVTAKMYLPEVCFIPEPSQASGLLQVEAGCDTTANRDTADLQKCRNFSVWNLDATFSLAHRGTPQKFVISTN